MNSFYFPTHVRTLSGYFGLSFRSRYTNIIVTLIKSNHQRKTRERNTERISSNRQTSSGAVQSSRAVCCMKQWLTNIQTKNGIIDFHSLTIFLPMFASTSFTMYEGTHELLWKYESFDFNRKKTKTE